MKKRTKAALLAAAFLIPVAVNHCIFRQARHKSRLKAKPITHKRYDWQFGRVHYVICGSGQPLLLVHDAEPGGSMLEWKACIRTLAKHHTVYALDLPGYGRSDKSPIQYSAYLSVSLLNDFVREIIGQTTAIIANGHGAAYAALACSFEPSLYRKMILVAPTGLDQVKTGRQPCSRMIKKWILESPWLGTTLHNLMMSRPALQMRMREQVYHQTALRDLAEQHYDMAHAGGANARFAAAAWESGFMDANISHALHQIKIPIRVVWGEYNTDNPVENLETVYHYKKDITAVVVKNTGRYPHWERPRAFCKACASFL